MTSLRRGFADIPGGQMHYRIVRPHAADNRATPLVMFPGAGESGRTLQRLVTCLGATRPTLVFDALGQGDSSPPSGPDAEIGEYADAAAQAIASLGLSKVDLFGTHAGGRIAAEIAIRHPDRARRLVLDSMRQGSKEFWSQYAATLDLSGHIDQEGTQFFKAFNRRRDSYLFFPPHQRAAANLKGTGLPSADEMHDSAIERFKGIRAGHILYRLAVLYPADARLPLIGVPTLFTSTPHDDRFGDLPRVAALVKGAAYRLYPYDESLETAPAQAIADYCTMLAEWLDSGEGTLG